MTARLIAWGLGILLIAGAFAGYSWHLEQIGAEKIKLQDAQDLADQRGRTIAQMQRDAATNEDATNALRQERDRLAAVAARPAPVIRLCNDSHGSVAVSAAAGAAGGSGDATAGRGNIPAVSEGTQPGPDIGPGMQRAMIRAEFLASQIRVLLARERALDRP